MKKYFLLLALLFAVVAGSYWADGYEWGGTGGGPAAVSAAGENEAVAEMRSLSPNAALSLITEPDDGVAPIADAIAGATKSLDLVIYELEDPTIEQELVDAKARGVAVRILLQNVNSFGNHPNQAAYDFLQSKSVAVKWAPKYFALTHQKTLIIDGTRAYVMTFNLTPQYYASSRDFGLIDDSAADVSAIADAFNDEWSGRQTDAANGDDLVWSPGSADVLVALITSASSTLDVYNEEMADPRVSAALEAAAARGVTVRVNMSYETSWKAALNDLVAHHVLVRTYASTAKFYIHAKAIIADGTTAFVGSENFSVQSLDSNRELGLLIIKPSIVTSLEATFGRDWQGSRPFVVN